MPITNYATCEESVNKICLTEYGGVWMSMHKYLLFHRYVFSNLDYFTVDMTYISLEKPGTSSNTTDYSGKGPVLVADVALAASTTASFNLVSEESTGLP